MKLKSIRDADVQGKKILLRVDYNVPIENNEVKDDTRIQRSLPTIKYLLENGAKLIICSHLGRPKGKIVPELSLKPVANYLSTLLKEMVLFCEDSCVEKAEAIMESLDKSKARIVVLENTRFQEGETKNDPKMASNLASFADIFVSDAFGTVHRAHASTVGVAKFLPAYAGFLVEEEYNRITSVMNNPRSPSVAIVGGAKVSTKLAILKKFVNIVDIILIGGGMAYTFLKSQGLEIGQSLCEAEMVETANDLLNQAKEKSVSIILPIDFRLSKTFNEPLIENGVAKIVSAENIPADAMGLDIGPETEKKFELYIKDANTIIWNGPMGVFEKELYRSGSKSVAKAVIDRAVDTIIGGGDTAYALNLTGITDFPKSIHISTGGGASLELLSGLNLPGIECLLDE